MTLFWAYRNYSLAGVTGKLFLRIIFLMVPVGKFFDHSETSTVFHFKKK